MENTCEVDWKDWRVEIDLEERILEVCLIEFRVEFRVWMLEKKSEREIHGKLLGKLRWKLKRNFQTPSILWKEETMEWKNIGFNIHQIFDLSHFVFAEEAKKKYLRYYKITCMNGSFSLNEPPI